MASEAAPPLKRAVVSPTQVTLTKVLRVDNGLDVNFKTRRMLSKRFRGTDEPL